MLLGDSKHKPEVYIIDQEREEEENDSWYLKHYLHIYC
jgi:hypothetical protein